MACSELTRLRCGVGIVALVLAAASCGKKIDRQDEDGDADAETDVGDEDAADVPVDGEEDVPVDATDTGEDGEVVDPCPSPGLHTGTPVVISDPGARIGGDTGLGADMARGGGVLGLGWSDGRLVETVTNEEVYLVVLEPDGTLVGSEVRVSNASLESRPPAVVWADDRFVAVWGDSRAMPAGNIFLGGVDSTAASLGAEAQVTTGGLNAMFVSAVWTGTHVGIAWTDNRDGTMDVYFARAATDGTMEGAITRVSDAAGNSFNPSVAWTGSSFIVVWADTMGREIWEFRIYMSILDSSGAVTSGPTMISGTDWDAKKPVAAWSDGVLGVCWEDYRDSQHEIYCAGYDGTGAETVAGARVLTTGANAASAILSPSLVPTDAGFGLAWADEDGVPGEDKVYFVTLSPSLEITDPGGTLVSGSTQITSVSLAWAGTSAYGMAWVEDDSSGTDQDTLHYLPFLYCE